MGWSINPSSLASIDQNGVLSYQQHTSDTVYTISYSDGDCSATKDVTIYACTPCNCADLTVTGKTDISKDSGSNITIGSFSKASCMSNPRASSSTSWLSSLSVSGNDIKATVEANSESSSRNGSVTVTVDKEGGGTCEKTMSITQQAGGGGATSYTISIKAGYSVIEKGQVNNLKIYYNGAAKTTIDVPSAGNSNTIETTYTLSLTEATSISDVISRLSWGFESDGYVGVQNANCGSYQMKQTAWDENIAEAKIPDGDCDSQVCKQMSTYVKDGSFCYQRCYLGGSFIRVDDSTIGFSFMASARPRD